MDRLPLDVLNLILFRLDHKLLAIMQCASRFLHSHISNDPYFGSEYLSRVRPGLFHLSKLSPCRVFSYPFCDPGSCKTEPLLWPCHVLGSCSGLLLCFVYGLFVVVNPLTKKVRFLDYSQSEHLPDIFLCPEYHKKSIGFAVDQIGGTTQRFKILFLIEEIKASNPYETTYRFEINAGDYCWKLSESTVTCPSSDVITGPVYLDGALHWLRNDGSIIAFATETEEARLIQIKSPPKMRSKTLFEAADNKLTLITATEEVIYLYTVVNILTDPNWVQVMRVRNVVPEKEVLNYWNLAAYDGKRLVLYDRKIYKCTGVVHEYDLRAKQWGVMGSIPSWPYIVQDFYQFKPSLSSVIQLDEEVPCDDGDSRFSTLSMIMRQIGEISPFALKVLEKKKRLIEEEEDKKLKIDMQKIRVKHIT